MPKKEGRKRSLKDWTPEIILLLAASILLFFNLGERALWGSEGRWAEVVRQMFLTGDFFHPRINGEPYFDKPLFTYWAIAIFVPIFGKLNEFVVRLPSALSGIVTLSSTYLLGKRLIGRKAGLMASWLLLTSWGFIFWARTAAADIENLAFITLASLWFVVRRDKRDLFSYLVFYGICAVGAQFKGLTAIAVPVLVAIIFIFIRGEIKRHINVSHLFSIIFGAALYLLPFIYAQMTSEGYAEQGLYLVFRENLLRFFNAFDHREPFYCYFYYVPILLMPWIFFFMGTLIDGFKNLKTLEKNHRWLFLSSLGIFLLFTISSSRRSYYILPILPFLTLSISSFLVSSSSKLRNFFIDIGALLIFFIGLIELLSVIIWPIIEKRFLFYAPLSLKVSTALIGFFAIFPFLVPQRYPFFKKEEKRSLAPLILSTFILFSGFFCIQQVQLEIFRSTKRILEQVKPIVQGLPEDAVALSKNMASVAFYLNRPKPLVNLERPLNQEQFFKRKGGKVLITRKKDVRRFKKYISSCSMELIISAPEYSWSHRNDKELAVYKINGPCIKKGQDI